MLMPWASSRTRWIISRLCFAAAQKRAGIAFEGVDTSFWRCGDRRWLRRRLVRVREWRSLALRVSDIMQSSSFGKARSGMALVVGFRQIGSRDVGVGGIEMLAKITPREAVRES